MSPYKLLQEQVDRDRHYPWRVIVSCALLNRTTGQQAHKAAGTLFSIWPNPVHWAHDHERWAPTAAFFTLDAILQPLGLVNRRTDLLHNLTVDYLAGISPYDCRGVGQYGRDALDIFCLGRTLHDPADHYLKAYVEWRRQGGPRIEWDEHEHVEWLAKSPARRG